MSTLPSPIQAADSSPEQVPTAAERHRAARVAHWNRTARSPPGRSARYYHRRLAQLYRHLVPERAAVLEIGSQTGDLLAALKPAVGVGIDFAPEGAGTEIVFVEGHSDRRGRERATRSASDSPRRAARSS